MMGAGQMNCEKVSMETVSETDEITKDSNDIFWRFKCVRAFKLDAKIKTVRQSSDMIIQFQKSVEPIT